MDSADRRRARRAEEGRRHTIRDRLRKSAEGQIQDAPHRLEIGADRRRISRRQHRTLRNCEVYRPEGAAVDRHVGKYVLERDVAGRERGVARDVERSARSRGRAREVEMHRIAINLHDEGDRDRLVYDAVVIEMIRARIDAVGNLGDVRTHLLLGARNHLILTGGHRLGAVTLDQAVETAPADREDIGHGGKIASDLFGESNVSAEHLDERLIRLPAFVELHRRDCRPGRP